MHRFHSTPIHEAAKAGVGTARPRPTRVKTVFAGDGALSAAPLDELALVSIGLRDGNLDSPVEAPYFASNL